MTQKLCRNNNDDEFDFFSNISCALKHITLCFCEEFSQEHVIIFAVCCLSPSCVVVEIDSERQNIYPSYLHREGDSF